MNQLLDKLKLRDRRGSKPRCHYLTHGSADQISRRLTALIAPFGSVSTGDRWMPLGFECIEEAELDKAPELLDPRIGKNLRAWWLQRDSPNLRTPNFDIASTCSIDNKPGLVLIEAKAHDTELIGESAGKRSRAGASRDSMANHERIGSAINSASENLREATALPWNLSRDSHYQMANRFAWAWKLTQVGFPVVLVYLGFLGAQEMSDRGKPFANASDWEQLVKAHSAPLFPPSVWNRRLTCNGQALIPLIRSLEQPLGLM